MFLSSGLDIDSIIGFHIPRRVYNSITSNADYNNFIFNNWF